LPPAAASILSGIEHVSPSEMLFNLPHPRAQVADLRQRALPRISCFVADWRPDPSRHEDPPLDGRAGASGHRCRPRPAAGQVQRRSFCCRIGTIWHTAYGTPNASCPAQRVRRLLVEDLDPLRQCLEGLLACDVADEEGSFAPLCEIRRATYGPPGVRCPTARASSCTSLISSGNAINCEPTIGTWDATNGPSEM
jgi:hypothetical protein